MRPGRGDDEADAVFAAAAGAPSHLLQLGSSERLPAIACATVRDRDDDRARRKIDPGGDSRSREDRIEQTRAHHLFNNQFPGWQVSRMMRGDSAAHDCVPMTVLTNLGILLNKAGHEIAPRIATLIFCIAAA